MIVLNLKRALYSILIFVLACVLIISPIIITSTSTSSPSTKYKILIDAGHGGLDGGAVGYSGTIESTLTLEYCKTLGNMLELYNFNTVYTRMDENGLYSAPIDGFKLEDMKKRREIIWNSNPDIVISIHMNKYPDSSSHGAQVFYQQGDTISLSLAQSIQNLIKINLQNTHRNVKSGDFYILQNPNIPSVIVECGFISNPSEEKLLQEDNYRNKFCYNIVAGIMSFYLTNLSN